MLNRVAHYIYIYAFVVFMILMRPYLAYQISTHPEFARDPEQVTRLLQRLVKKKESHVDDNNEAMELVQANSIQIVLPLLFVLILRRRLSWLLSLLSGANLNWSRNTVFQVSPSNNYYQLISKLQI
ncbi:MAG TPA: hypothetical protein VGC01_05785 [Mucilaginibacter sp.]